MHRLGITTTAALLALGVGLTACGGSGSKALSRAELGKRANAICQDAGADAQKLKQPADNATPEQRAAWLGKVSRVADTMTRNLAALAPDDAAKADWDVFLAKEKANDALYRTIGEKAHKNDPSLQRDLRRILPLADAIATAARKVGATGCTD
jgi:hypothetical protein